MALPPSSQYHVLAVDDSLLDRKLIEKLLKTSSYQVTTVDSGDKALEFLGLQDDHGISPSVSSYQQEIEVNMIITDYCMPGMTGYDLLKRVKESAYLKDIPVVIMSSENIPSRINRCLEEGAEEFFLKPVKLSDMKKLKPHLLKGKSTPKDHRAQQSGAEQQLLVDNIDISTSIPTTAAAPKAGSNKRKVMEGQMSPPAPERTRPSFKDYGLTAVV